MEHTKFSFYGTKERTPRDSSSAGRFPWTSRRQSSALQQHMHKFKRFKHLHTRTRTVGSFSSPSPDELEQTLSANRHGFVNPASRSHQVVQTFPEIPNNRILSDFLFSDGSFQKIPYKTSFQKLSADQSEKTPQNHNSNQHLFYSSGFLLVKIQARHYKSFAHPKVFCCDQNLQDRNCRL